MKNSKDLPLIFITFVVGFSFLQSVDGKPSVAISQGSVPKSPGGSIVQPENKVDELRNGPFTAFISYRRSTSKHLARLLKILLKERKVPAFLDIDDLRIGHWDDQLINAIKTTPHFVFLLSNGSLDRCIGDLNYTDVVHQEIKTAVDSKRNIIPIFDDFIMPAADFSPEINEMMKFQGLEWNHSYVEGSIERLVGYLNENPVDLNNNTSLTKKG